MFCRSLFVRLSFFHVRHCIYCLFLFDLRLLITHFVSSNSNSLMLSSHITWITTSYFIRVIIWCHVTYHILFHRNYHLISRDLPHPISSELSSQSLSPSHLYEPEIQLPLSHVNSSVSPIRSVHVYKFILLMEWQVFVCFYRYCVDSIW
jgi:hypothetical protein